MLDILSRPEVYDWLGSRAPMTDLEAARAWVDAARRHEEADPYDVARAVVVRESGVLVGKVSVARAHRRDTGLFVGEYEVGWWLHPEAAGHGYATEAARALLDDVFARGLPEVWCGMYLGNDASARVAERLGLELVGEGPDPWWPGESRLYRISAGDWSASSPSASGS